MKTMRYPSWTYGYCEVCMKNSHKKVKMKRKFVLSPDSDNMEEMWICTKCGATKRL